MKKEIKTLKDVEARAGRPVGELTVERTFMCSLLFQTGNWRDAPIYLSPYCPWDDDDELDPDEMNLAWMPMRMKIAVSEIIREENEVKAYRELFRLFLDPYYEREQKKHEEILLTKLLDYAEMISEENEYESERRERE